MSDLFFEEFSNQQIAAVFGVMAACPEHHFLILTKRPERMAEWFRWIGSDARRARERCAEAALQLLDPATTKAGGVGIAGMTLIDGTPRAWPLPNVWLGVSAERQQEWDERKGFVHSCPAAVHFASFEPLLGPIDLHGTGRLHLSWAIVGGESGPGSRKCDIDWIDGLVRQCRESDIPVFCKQLGAKVYDRNDAGFDGDDGDSWPEFTQIEDYSMDPNRRYQGAPVRVLLTDRAGGDPLEWPERLRIREFPNEARP
jgi:protein gp37